MNKQKCFRALIIVMISLIFTGLTSPAVAVDFQGNIKARYDKGQEVNNQIGKDYPDNLVDRTYFEGLLTAELHFNKIPVGKRLRLGIRMVDLEASNYDRNYTPLDNQRRIDDKIYAQWNIAKWEVWAGDVTETFGKGLALSLYENRDLYFNTALRGGKVNYTSKKLRAKAVYGNSREWFNIQEDVVGGVNLEYRPWRVWHVGLNLVHHEGLNYEKRFTPGVYSGLKIGPVSLYGEYAQRRPDDGDISVGDGTYLSVESNIQGVSTQINYKYYNFGIENPFQTPPIAEREIMTHLLTQHPHVPDMVDQVGFEVNLSATPVEQLFVDLNFSRSSKHDGNNPLPTLKQEDAAYWNFYGETEWYAHPNVTSKLAFGTNEEAYPAFWQEKTGIREELTINLSELWSVTTDLENMWVNDREEETKYTDQFFAVSLAKASLGSVYLSYEQTGSEDTSEGDHWIGAEVLFEMLKNHRFTLFFGQERGGLKCSSGVCRTVQSFEGLRLTYEGRF